MNCRNVERLLSSYLALNQSNLDSGLDNSLTDAYRDEVKEHLAKCENCKNYLDTITEIDNLVKLKVKEKPSKEYWENYWRRLESKLYRTVTARLSENRRLSNFFLPTRFSSAFSGVIIALLILVNGLLYINIQELKSSMMTIAAQEKIENELYRNLARSRENLTP